MFDRNLSTAMPNKHLVLSDESSKEGRGQPAEELYEKEDIKHNKEGQCQDRENYLNQVSQNYINQHSNKGIDQMKMYNQEEQSTPSKLPNVHSYKNMQHIHKQDQNIYQSDQRENNYEDKDIFTTYDLVNILVEERFVCETQLNILETKDINPIIVKKIVKENSHIFYTEGEKVFLKPQICLCAPYGYEQCPNKKSCQDLHICNKYILEKCHDKSCNLGHKWDTNHNIKILKYFRIDHLSSSILVKLISSVLKDNSDENTFKLNICESYNSSSCHNKMCNYLHICRKMVNSKIICKTHMCPLNHNLLEESCVEILNLAGISTNETTIDILETIMMEMGNISDNSSIHNSYSHNFNQETVTNYDQKYYNRRQTVWAFFECGDVNKEEICYYSVEGICRFESGGCPRLHSNNHFHWQVSRNGINWINFQPHQSDHFERQFCDPAIEEGDLLPVDYSKDGDSVDILKKIILRDYLWTVDFLEMKIETSNRSRFLRRLCTEKKIFPEVPSHTFIWYCLIDGKCYVCIDRLIKKKEFNSQNQEISELIENRYIKYIKDDKHKIMCFKDMSFYIDFKKMQVKITNNKTIMKLRRRPMIDSEYCKTY
ncbi:unnamed protein product, partial [Meganyctiphanes norvegica]